jgi:hypothetical protein
MEAGMSAIAPSATLTAPAISSFRSSAVVRVGDSGRGVIVAGEFDQRRYIVTAAHCLPRSRYPRPMAMGTSGLRKFVGALAAKRTVSVDVTVLNLIEDVAVLGSLDDQQCWELAEEYEQFTLPCMVAGDAPARVEPWNWHRVPGANGWVLSLDMVWTPCTIHRNDRFLTVSGAKIEPGMSGSPILNARGEVIGIISMSGENLDEDYGNNWHPSLADCLPPWLWRKLMTRTEYLVTETRNDWG